LVVHEELVFVATGLTAGIMLDGRMADIFQAWEERWIATDNQRAADALDALSGLAGLTRFEFIRRTAVDEVRLPAADARPLQATFLKHQASVRATLSQAAPWHELTEAVRARLGEWKIPRLVAKLIVAAYYHDLDARTRGGIAHHLVESVPFDPPAPPMNLEPVPGETVSEQAARLKGAEASLRAVMPPTGRVDRRRYPALLRSLHRYYRNRVRGESISAIARQAFGVEGGKYAAGLTTDQRKAIRRDVQEVEALLRLIVED